MEFCKLQMGCMLVILYVTFVYMKECIRFKHKRNVVIFDAMLLLGIICVLFDGLTAYTVNHLDKVDAVLNRGLHLMFLLSLDTFIFLLFLYMLSITSGLPARRINIALLCCPFVINVLLVVVNIPSLQYIEGEISNYSMGYSAYTCFIMAGIYILLSMILCFGRWKYIESHKRISVLTYLIVLACITGYQMFYPQSLLSSICVTIIVLGVYINQENPTVQELAHYHEEMVMGFATLVENKDGSTGGHIKRTKTYVQMLLNELKRRGLYKETLTKDYINNLCKAAPMHDVGKISVPDVVLQKPGKLTDEEYSIMKMHTVSGGKIIEETFGHLGDKEYTKMAYEVAMYHHEKWNGKGYPNGLKRKDIPLSARIMAIADVFDAVSEKRCYRDALPLDKCFEIISEGSGQDFDPVLAEVFLDMRPDIEAVINRE